MKTLFLSQDLRDFVEDRHDEYDVQDLSTRNKFLLLNRSTVANAYEKLMVT